MPDQGDKIQSQNPPEGEQNKPLQAGRQRKSDLEITLPAAAGDQDLIEKEWVEKAKKIVEHTRDDPHEQQRALAQMKADYMKKRYNRESKSDGS